MKLGHKHQQGQLATEGHKSLVLISEHKGKGQRLHNEGMYVCTNGVIHISTVILKSALHLIELPHEVKPLMTICLSIVYVSIIIKE